MMEPSGTKDRRALFLRLAGTIITLGLLVYLFSQRWGEILVALAQIDIWRLAIALVLTLGSRLAITGRWHVLLKAVNLDIHVSQTARLTFAGLFASNFLPTTVGGDVIRLAAAVQMKFDAAISAASLVVDRLVGMAGMAMAIPFGVPRFIQSGVLDKFLNVEPETLVPLYGLATVLPENLQSRLLRILKKLGRALKVWSTKPAALLSALAFSWLHMLFLFASIAILLADLNEGVNFLLIAGMWSVVYFITLLPVSINGYGLQEISLVFVFERVGGVSQPAALTIALLIRTVQMVASLPGAFFVPGILAARAEVTQIDRG